jgi:hypothetical protein
MSDNVGRTPEWRENAFAGVPAPRLSSEQYAHYCEFFADAISKALAHGDRTHLGTVRAGLANAVNGYRRHIDQIGSATDSSQRSERQSGQERSAKEELSISPPSPQEPT